MPRYEAIDVEKELQPIQLIIYVSSAVFLGLSTFNFINNSSSILSAIYFIVAVLFFTYTLGRIYGYSTLERDFIQITKEKISFRSTPAFGMGWLPESGKYLFADIEKADLVQLTNYQNQGKKKMALQLRLLTGREIIIGNNLSDDQIIKIGLALKGTVTLSNALKSFLGSTNEQLGDQIQDIVSKGKAIWNTLTSTNQKEGDE